MTYSKPRTIAILFLCLLLLNSCILHPRYSRPCMDIPCTWRIPVDESSSYANYRWWQQLGDPVLDNLIVEALEANQDLKVAIARVYQYIGQLLVARSPLYPQIGGSAAAFRQQSSLNAFPLGGFNRISSDYLCLFEASYDLDLWGKIRSGSEAAQASLFAQVEARRAVVLNLVASVASAYIQLRLFDLQLKTSIQTYKSRKEAYDIAELRFLGGLTSELDAVQAQAEMETALVQVIQFEQAIIEQENFISLLIGRPSQPILRGLELDEFRLTTDIPAGIPSQILEQRPDILQAEYNLIAANAEIGVAKANFFPDISLTGFYGNQSVQLNNLFTAPSRTWQYGGSLLQPIFTGGLLIGELQIAESQKWQAYHQYQQTVLNAFREVNDALTAHQKTKELLEVEKRRVKAQQDALSLANLQYSNGQVEYLNVLDAQRNLFDAELSADQVQGDLFLSLVNIYKSLGGGWVIEADCWAIE